jgi:hypothetical protein
MSWHLRPSQLYLINPCNQSICVSFLSFLGNGSVNNYRCNEYTSNNRRNVGRVVFYAVRVILRKEAIISPRVPCLIMYKYTLLFFNMSSTFGIFCLYIQFIFTYWRFIWMSASCSILFPLTLQPWRLKRYVPPMHFQCTFTSLHGVTSHKIALFILSRVLCVTRLITSRCRGCSWYLLLACYYTLYNSVSQLLFNYLRRSIDSTVSDRGWISTISCGA